MRYLIDTHTFLWFVEGSNQLSDKVLQIISSNDNDVLLSIASLWEISIKSSLGKLKINDSFDTVIKDVRDNNINILPIEFNHILANHNLEHHHKDPFDRIIAAQCLSEDLDIISKDSIFDLYFKQYSVNRIW